MLKTKSPVSIEVLLPPREFILSHGLLSMQPAKTGPNTDNSISFKRDYLQGTLSCYEGSAVAYQKGVLCGQSKDKMGLYRRASEYYGASGLAVFVVPNNVQQLETVCKERLSDSTWNP